MCETSQNNFSKSYIVVIDFSSDWFKCVAMRQVWLGERDGGEGGGDSMDTLFHWVQLIIVLGTSLTTCGIQVKL